VYILYIYGINKVYYEKADAILGVRFFLTSLQKVVLKCLISCPRSSVYIVLVAGRAIARKFDHNFKETKQQLVQP